MRLASSPGRWSDGGFPRGTSSRRIWLAVAGVAMVALLAIAVVTCGADEPSSGEPLSGDYAEMFGEANADFTRIGPSSPALTETEADDFGIDFWDLIGDLWTAVSTAAGALGPLLWTLVWGALKIFSPLLTIGAFLWATIAAWPYTSYHQVWERGLRSAGVGVLACLLPLLIWIFA